MPAEAWVTVQEALRAGVPDFCYTHTRLRRSLDRRPGENNAITSSFSPDTNGVRLLRARERRHRFLLNLSERGERSQFMKFAELPRPRNNGLMLQTAGLKPCRATLRSFAHVYAAHPRPADEPNDISQHPAHTMYASPCRQKHKLTGRTCNKNYASIIRLEQDHLVKSHSSMAAFPG